MSNAPEKRVLRVKDWAKFQHYKHRKPPWIRLYRDLLDDVTWHRLPIASRALAPMLWLLASETPEGKIEGDSDALAFRLRLASEDFEAALKPLISSGWIIESDPASVLLAPRKQLATSESESETDSLTTNHTVAARDASLAVNGYAPRAQHLTMKQRMAELAARKRLLS